MSCAPTIEKQCRRCLLVKPISEFHTQRTAKGYLSIKYICKPCSAIVTKEYYHSHPETRRKVAQRAKEWAKANPDKIRVIARQAGLKKRYGISEADYQTMFATQHGRCLICESEDCGRTAQKWVDGRFHVDHNHTTGAVRGLLCHGCNVRLGGFERLLKDKPILWLLKYIGR